MDDVNIHAACSNTSARSRVWLVLLVCLVISYNASKIFRGKKIVDDAYNEFSENFVDLIKMIKISQLWKFMYVYT